jgi:hypothetical protein
MLLRLIIEESKTQFAVSWQRYSPDTFLRHSRIIDIDYSKQTLRIFCNNQDDIEFFVRLYRTEIFGRILQKMRVLLLDLDER